MSFQSVCLYDCLSVCPVLAPSSKKNETLKQIYVSAPHGKSNQGVNFQFESSKVNGRQKLMKMTHVQQTFDI